MVLVITLTLAAFIGIIFGIVKKSKTAIVASSIGLIIIIILLLGYIYLYSKNPY